MTSTTQLYEHLGMNVSRLREEQGLSKKTFALMCGISRPHLDKIEKGAADVRLSHLQKIADALNVEPVVLLQTSKAGPHDAQPQNPTP